MNHAPQATSSLVMPMAMALCLTAALTHLGCDGDTPTTPSQHTPSSPGGSGEELVARPFPELEALELVESSGLERALEVGKSSIWPSCYVEMEERGEPVEKLELLDKPERLGAFLIGCEMEAWARGEKGEYYFTYSLKTEDRLRAADQRISAYDSRGKLLWHYTIDRDSDPMNFASSRRSSFAVEMPPYLFCSGTRWDGSLEYLCVKKEDGTIAWQGKLPYWSGTDPIGHQKSLTFGDISTLKKIYPWEGVERMSETFDGTGGYSSVYVTDGRHYLFGPNRAPWKHLTAYDLDGLRPIWKLETEEAFDPLWAHAFARHDLTLLRQGEDIVAIQTSTGEGLWRLTVGPDAPPVVSDDQTIYLLVRRAQGPNLIQAIAPQTGAQLWYTVPPTGTLDLFMHEGSLYLKSIRSVQRAWLEKEPGATTSPKRHDATPSR